MPSHVEAPATRRLGSTSLYRVARSDAPLRPSSLEPVDAGTNAGNRFDVQSGGVLYFASDPTGCYAETLARFRPSAAMRAALEDDEEWASKFIVCGGVPSDWRTRRLKVEVKTRPEGLPILDIEDPLTLEFLTSELSGVLANMGIKQLDVSNVRGGNRTLTRSIANYAYWASKDDVPLYDGIRYVSRLGDHELWAMFEDAPLREVSRETIQLTDPALAAVANTFGLRLF